MAAAAILEIEERAILEIEERVMKWAFITRF
jgi:hypothetical protein